MNHLQALSCSSEENEIKVLLSQVIILNQSLFCQAAEKAGLNFQQKMSVSNAVQFISLLRFSKKKMRDLRHILANTLTGNFLPSEKQMRRSQLHLTSHLNSENIDSGKITFNVSKKTRMCFFRKKPT